MSSDEQKSHRMLTTVRGYVRKNYLYNVPEAIMRIFFKYIDQNFIVSFKGSRLKQFLLCPRDHYYRYSIKFNQELSFLICIIPSADGERTALGFQIESMSNKIDYIMVCWELSCFDVKSFSIGSVKICAKSNQQEIKEWKFQSIGSVSQLQKYEILLFNFKILSLQIMNKDTNKMTYYPSLKAIQLKQVSTLKWNASKSLINNFKSYPHKAGYNGPIQDNLCIICGPNGFLSRNEGIFGYGVVMTVFPRNTSKIVVKVRVKVELEDDKFEREIENEIHHDGFWVIPDRGFSKDKLKEKLLFEAEVIVKELYDLNGNKVPRNEWIDHNVIISTS